MGELIIKKVLIVADMEGCSFIKSKHQVFTNSLKPTEFGRKAMEYDVNAVLEGLGKSGIKEVFIADWHDTCNNIRKKNLKTNKMKISILKEEFPEVCKRVKDKIDMAIFVGFHAKSGKKSILSHFYSFSVRNFFIDGKKRGETALNIYTLNYYKKPVVLVSGSYDAVKEAQNIDKNILGVITRKGFRVYSRKKVHDELVRKSVEAVTKPIIFRKLFAQEMRLEFEDDSKYKIKGKNVVEKHKKIESIVEKYLKERRRSDSNSHILKNPRIK